MTWTCEMKDLQEFLTIGLVNDKFLYHKGYSVTDTVYSVQIGKYIYDKAIKGKVYLVTKRLSSFNHLSEFDFIAIKASISPVRSLLPYSEAKTAERHQKTVNQLINRSIQRERANEI